MDAELEPLGDALMLIMTGDDWRRLINDASFSSISRLVQVRSGLIERSRESPQLAKEWLLSTLRTTRNDAPDLLAEMVRLVGSLHCGAPQSRDRVVDNVVSGGTFHAPLIQASTINGGQHTYYGQSPYFALPLISAWPRLNMVDPIAFGVRSTRRLADESPLPPYVERDCDEELGDRVREAAREGGLVVVTGAPLSGKTRTVWAALAANLPRTTRVFAPSPGTDLRGLPAVVRRRGEAGCVLWLDNLGGHLGEHGLTPALLAELVRLRVPVLATMEDEAYDARRFGASGRAGVLSAAEPVELPRVWSEGELERLDMFDGDPRLRAAAVWRGVHTVPEYLAVGPELMEEWRRARRPDAHPRGHLLVRVAIDFARCGLMSWAGIHVDKLREALDLYPEESVGAEAEPFEEGLEWAADIRHGVTGLLVPGWGGDTWTAFGSLVADVEHRGDSPRVPLGMWSLALAAATDKGARRSVRWHAHRLLVPVAESDPEAAVTLGAVNARVGELGTAKYWYRAAADAGHTEAAATLGELLVALDAEAEAIPYLEQAAEAGVVRAQYYLGVLLAERAHTWLSRAAEAGHPLAARALPSLREVTDTRPDNVKE
ncbi:tetratricopeptide repeat protein [Streptomyces cyaneofuscatus]|uniref:tetratricopeptide repeat protein n=1 Tax=Streptomyces cyaneofuscatus TaxID=66883 RepID=UPI0037F35ED4